MLCSMAVPWAAHWNRYFHTTRTYLWHGNSSFLAPPDQLEHCQQSGYRGGRSSTRSQAPPRVGSSRTRAVLQGRAGGRGGCKRRGHSGKCRPAGLRDGPRGSGSAGAGGRVRRRRFACDRAASREIRVSAAPAHAEKRSGSWLPCIRPPRPPSHSSGFAASLPTARSRRAGSLRGEPAVALAATRRLRARPRRQMPARAPRAVARSAPGESWQRSLRKAHPRRGGKSTCRAAHIRSPQARAVVGRVQRCRKHTHRVAQAALGENRRLFQIFPALSSPDVFLPKIEPVLLNSARFSSCTQPLS